ncbi:MAG: acetyl-CoA carboxylase carboxyl transferase subunit alpha [Halobacteriovoraceae bacterium]|nr:acetyl-CoA carboxylase carboxyl transferase subunit alpha [Halobacteriovoraceae bacterium]|tara:strand:- start:39427 stop:40395 length:969 start_codon:yes stop_codon:yes gene_type:complete
MDYELDFEKPVHDLENQIKELKEANSRSGLDINKEISALQTKVDHLLKEIYDNLSPWERVQLSRHPKRPHTLDYIDFLLEDFHEIHGDRRFSEDPAMIAGFGYLDGQKLAVVGIQKGRKTQDKIKHNFGMARPEGYRKAMRLMKLAEQFDIPVLCLVDTPGAYPGIGAEERGQAQAIAENLQEMFDIKVPMVAIVIGEGGSGGALGIAIADRVHMLEYSVYSVISPESCASILWSDPKRAEQAANSLKLDPNKAKELKIIDSIIKEPTGGAHRDFENTALNMKKRIQKDFKELGKFSCEDLMEARFEKYRKMGNTTTTEANS